MRRRAGTRSARRARPRRAQAAPGSEPAAKGSLRDAAVGCPERAQVGPLPWLSKSRRAGLWSAIRTPGSLVVDCWATRTLCAPHREHSNSTNGAHWESVLWGPRDVVAGGTGRAPLEADPYYRSDFSVVTTLMCSSSSCDWSTSEGAPSIRSDIDCVFGNAITSRMLSVPPSIITMRSMPGAIPP